MSFKWETKKLEDVSINLNNKRVPLSSREREQLKKIYPYYGAQGIIDYVDSYIFDGEFLLIAEDGENLKSRKQNIANIAKGKFWVNNHAHILLNNKDSDLYYLYYYLNSIDISGYITGSVQPKLSKANLNSIRILLPPILEQKGIANILRALDDKIELNNAINKNLEEMAQALFKRWFVDFEFPNENGEPYKSSGGEFEESELGLIPKGWRVGRATDIFDVQSGGTPRTSTSEYWNGEIPFFTPKDCSNSSYVINTEKTITEDGLNNCNSKLYKIDTVFITARGTVGKVALAGRDMAMNQSCYALLAKNGYTQKYVFHQTQQLINVLRKNASGAVFDAITVSTFQNLKTILPDTALVMKFDELVNELYSLMLEK
ncbi:hypothetical protein PACILC2_40490 [Paenibacillus cisolokensis]|uniref:Type I restriction modification DNA specificity domain-containing protein n=1 Tax=Paenibacillus cisolokensis TaxID=1658519 RepID=A0ABQ4NB72_9BACL|nr:restriction endonuclease subunit S [Paenibacillus cisolokensis]GIQ65481.1 hypothetical protein PACILC2_40490 [Paenibacillus cisolokensis]